MTGNISLNLGEIFQLPLFAYLFNGNYDKIERMRKKLLVTGFSGFVAGSVIAQAQHNWEVHGIGRNDPPSDTEIIKYHKLDLLETEEVRKQFHEIKPDAVIHTAAMADIDFCQKNQNIAEKVNVGITKTLADLCEETGGKLVFCSTDTVFDGGKGYYNEEDVPNAINHYAETKIKSEQIIINMKSSGVVARLSLVMGLPVIGAGNSFLAKTIDKLKNGESVKFPENETRTPIDVITLGKALIELAGNDFSGIIHLSGNSRLTRYEMARQIAIELGYSPKLIIAINSNAMKGRAPRPSDVSMDNSKARKILKTPILSLKEGINSTMNYKKEE